MPSQTVKLVNRQQKQTTRLSIFYFWNQTSLGWISLHTLCCAAFDKANLGWTHQKTTIIVKFIRFIWFTCTWVPAYCTSVKTKRGVHCWRLGYGEACLVQQYIRSLSHSLLICCQHQYPTGRQLWFWLFSVKILPQRCHLIQKAEKLLKNGLQSTTSFFS